MRHAKMINIEVADDQEQPRVTIPHATLAQVEKLCESLGMGETTMPLVMHHFLIGGLSYLASAPISKMRGNEVKQFVTKNKAALRMLARSVAKSNPNKEEEDSDPH